MKSQSWLCSSSIHEPSDPPLKVISFGNPRTAQSIGCPTYVTRMHHYTAGIAKRIIQQLINRTKTGRRSRFHREETAQSMAVIPHAGRRLFKPRALFDRPRQRKQHNQWLLPPSHQCRSTQVFRPLVEHSIFRYPANAMRLGVT
jgi:hypothetical protein